MDAIVQHMTEQGILFETDGQLAIGIEAEAVFGRHNFMDLFSVFISPPLITVRHGRTDIGEVHETTFSVSDDQAPVVLTLAGQHWAVRHLDWKRRCAHVEPTAIPGRSRWLNPGSVLSFQLCQTLIDVLTDGEIGAHLSQRAQTCLAHAKADFAWLSAETTPLTGEPSGGMIWWTFAGQRLNAAIGHRLRQSGMHVTWDNYRLRFRDQSSGQHIRAQIDKVLQDDSVPFSISQDLQASLPIKFTECVPVPLVCQLVETRMAPVEAFAALRRRPIREIEQDMDASS